jgi:hypothetical protein
VLPLERGSGGRILLAFSGYQGRAVRDDPHGVLLCLGRRARFGNGGRFGTVLRHPSDAPRRADARRSSLANRRDLHRQRARIAAARRCSREPTRSEGMPPRSMGPLR